MFSRPSSAAAYVLDKDGTLFDFAATWTAWARATLLDLAEGDASDFDRNDDDLLSVTETGGGAGAVFSPS